MFRNQFGEPEALHYKFYDDLLSHQANPVPQCPTLIIHGTKDDVVPISLSRKYVESHPQIRLIEVDDDHRLQSSVDIIEQYARKFLIEKIPIDEL